MDRQLDENSFHLSIFLNEFAAYFLFGISIKSVKTITVYPGEQDKPINNILNRMNLQAFSGNWISLKDNIPEITYFGHGTRMVLGQKKTAMTNW